jgi:FkbM family methyltransferase
MNWEPVKRQVGRALFRTCELWPQMKPHLKPWGLRTSPEWFEGCPARVQLREGAGFRLVGIADNYLSFELFWRGAEYYEPITRLVAGELVAPGRGVTFIDAGANIGFYSLALSALQPELKVIAFEPNPKNFNLLAANARANQFCGILCERLALSDQEGRARLFLSPSDMSASLQSDFDSRPTGSVEVNTRTLDGYLARHPVPDRLVIKVDVEGHEAAFFRGARETLNARRPDVIAEVAVTYAEETKSLLESAGYRFYQITDEGLLESEELEPVVRGQFVFLNYLLSPRPQAELEALFARIRDRVREIDLRQTSKFRDAAAIREFEAREAQTRAGRSAGMRLTTAV